MAFKVHRYGPRDVLGESGPQPFLQVVEGFPVSPLRDQDKGVLAVLQP